MADTVLFDMDGVLIDSEDVSVQVGIDYFRSKGLSLSRSDFEPFLGAGERVFFCGPAEARGFSFDLEEASRYFRLHYAGLLEKYSAGRPDGLALRTVRKLRSLGFRLAVCSSAPRWKVLVNIRHTGLQPEDFDTVISGDDISANKPDGQIYLTAMQRLGRKGSDCLVVEDSINGVKAGKNAGALCLGVMTTCSPSELAAAGADFIASDISVLMRGETMKEVNENLAQGLGDDRKLYGANYVLKNENLIKRNSIELMISLAAQVREKAYAPYSHFKVGACLRSAATGRLYTGCNVENSSYGATLCAERNALFHAVASEGIIGVDALVVYSDDDPPAPPCALCLQALAEFTAADSLVILVSKKGERRQYRFDQLLPNPFIFPSERK